MLVALCTCTRRAAPRRCAAGGVLGEVDVASTLRRWTLGACKEFSSTAGVLALSMRLVHVDLATRHVHVAARRACAGQRSPNAIPRELEHGAVRCLLGQSSWGELVVCCIR